MRTSLKKIKLRVLLGVLRTIENFGENQTLKKKKLWRRINPKTESKKDKPRKQFLCAVIYAL